MHMGIAVPSKLRILTTVFGDTWRDMLNNSSSIDYNDCVLDNISEIILF